jgi:hypothetical protein
VTGLNRAASATGAIGKTSASVEHLLSTPIKIENDLYIRMWRDFQKYIRTYLLQGFDWGEEAPFSRNSTVHGARANFEWFHALQAIIGLNELYYYLTYFEFVVAE